MTRSRGVRENLSERSTYLRIGTTIANNLVEYQLLRNWQLEFKQWQLIRSPQGFSWLACGVLALVDVLVIAGRLVV